MKALNTFPIRDILEKIYNSDKLRRDFDDYMQDVENNYLADICDRLQGCEYSIGLFNRNFISPRNMADFLDGAGDIDGCFGGSEALEKEVRHAEGLRGSNLFEYACRKVAAALLDWLDAFCAGVEDVSYKIYQHEVCDEALQYVEMFAENGHLDGIYVTNDGGLCRLERL